MTIIAFGGPAAEYFNLTGILPQKLDSDDVGSSQEPAQPTPFPLHIVQPVQDAEQSADQFS
jgi:hypothetical protein